MAQHNLKDIGNVLKLRETIDQDHRVTKHIRANLSVVDIIPVDYQLRLDKINVGDKNGNNNGMAIVYDFTTPINEYRSLLSHYKLDEYSGLRLWLTDDSQVQEEFGHDFENNIIESAINSIADKGVELRQLLRSMGNSGLNTAYHSLVENLANMAGGAAEGGMAALDSFLSLTGIDSSFGEVLGGITNTAMNTAATVVSQGKRVSLPKIWRDSRYTPSVTLNIKLVSPYGHKDAIKYFIIEPLLYLLILTAPRTKDGISYGLYQPVRVKGYGLSNINLGAITNVNVKRGGKDTAYNIWKQPLILDIALSVLPLVDGFAVMEPGTPDIADFTDADQEYEEDFESSPAITTVGNMIQSLRPAPKSVINQSIEIFNPTKHEDFYLSDNPDEKDADVSEEDQITDNEIVEAALDDTSYETYVYENSPEYLQAQKAKELLYDNPAISEEKRQEVAEEISRLKQIAEEKYGPPGQIEFTYENSPEHRLATILAQTGSIQALSDDEQQRLLQRARELNIEAIEKYGTPTAV